MVEATHRTHFPRISRPLRGYRRRTPPFSRAPTPHHVMVAKVGLFVHLKNIEKGASDVVERPRELATWRVQRFAASRREGGKLAHVSRLLGAGDGGCHNQTQVWDDTVVFVDLVWLGLLLPKFAKSHEGPPFLFRPVPGGIQTLARIGPNPGPAATPFVKTTPQKTRFRSVNSTRNSRTGQN